MIEKIKSRAKAEREEPEGYSGTFKILSLDKSGPVWQMKVVNTENREDMVVRIANELVADDLLSGDNVKQLINQAFYKDCPVDMEIVCAKTKNFLTGVEKHRNDESFG